MNPPPIQTLGELKKSGYVFRTVKEELRHNLILKLKAKQPVFEGMIGYERTVIPQIQNALLARHDLILLGLRGQGKTRLIRMLASLLDEYIPFIEGSELNENPLNPITKYGKNLVNEKGDETPITWLHRSERYTEKLATPDTNMADLIGDIDPIKAATRRLTYADEEVIHFGLIPRANRGIFAINELPDLQPRIQVGLLNIMEEQDVQIRGFNLRIPLDLLLVFTANPEDYTNRGSIITPLKDRIDSQIITHYPKNLETGIEITRQEAWQERGGGVQIEVPHFFREIIEQVAFEARTSEYIDQKSGVSVRMTRSALEALISAAERRALFHHEQKTTVRISDLLQVEPAITGKVELVYEGEQEGAQNVARLLIGKAVKAIFLRYFPDPADKKSGKAAYKEVLNWFAKGNSLTFRHDMDQADYHKALTKIHGLEEMVQKTIQTHREADKLVMMEWVLEALHQHSLVGKDYSEFFASYSDIVGSMLSGIGNLSDEDEDWDDDTYRRPRK
ncbi:MAG: sigma 54-interacting transcriptional regulator [Bacteroidetes Order II. Incertae sedis bacterium]|nr:sigma 54-interacting transcriptional regulator [Bacteroidetes Order II. bacterium]